MNYVTQLAVPGLKEGTAAKLKWNHSAEVLNYKVQTSADGSEWTDCYTGLGDSDCPPEAGQTWQELSEEDLAWHEVDLVDRSWTEIESQCTDNVSSWDTRDSFLSDWNTADSEEYTWNESDAFAVATAEYRSTDITVPVSESVSVRIGDNTNGEPQQWLTRENIPIIKEIRVSLEEGQHAVLQGELSGDMFGKGKMITITYPERNIILDKLEFLSSRAIKVLLNIRGKLMLSAADDDSEISENVMKAMFKAGITGLNTSTSVMTIISKTYLNGVN